MSSRILARDMESAIAPMVWRTTTGTAAEPREGGLIAFQPPKSVPTTEVATLMSRVAELERSSRFDAAEAYRKGLAEGDARSSALAQSKLQAVLDQVAQTAHELTSIRSRLRREAESDVVQLAIAIARRILHREISIDPAAMQALVQVALKRLDRQEIHRVWVHPSQAAAVQATLAGETQQVEVIADANRELGSLLFETNRGKLDASVNAQFEEIERGLADRVNQR